MLRDLRHGVRTLLQAKGWTAVVVLSLALGIGANTALFSAINGLYLRKLPVRDPDTLVRLRWAGRNDMATNSSDYGSRGGPDAIRATVSYPMYRQYLEDNRTMEDLFACAPYGRANIVVDGRAEIANAFITTGNYYQMLGLSASPGRTIVPDDDRPAATPVAVISARYWRSRFGSDPHVVGKAVTFNNVPITIVGVIAPELVGVQQVFRDGPDIAVPLALDAQLESADRGGARHADCAPPVGANDVVAAGDGTPQARRDRRTGSGQPRDRVPAHSAGRLRRVLLVAAGDDADRARAIRTARRCRASSSIPAREASTTSTCPTSVRSQSSASSSCSCC